MTKSALASCECTEMINIQQTNRQHHCNSWYCNNNCETKCKTLAFKTFLFMNIPQLVRMSHKSDFQTENSISGKHVCCSKNKIIQSSILMTSPAINLSIEAFCWLKKNIISSKNQYTINILTKQQIYYSIKRNIYFIEKTLYFPQ